MKARGLDIRRLRLTAICTVCTRAFLKEVKLMNEVVAALGPPGSEGSAGALVAGGQRGPAAATA